MRVLIYSAIRLFGDTLVACLQKEQEITEVRFEDQLDRLTSTIEETTPRADVVLFDITCARGAGVVRELSERFPNLPVVALAVPRVADEVIACADAGFTSYVPRDSHYTELISIIRMALRGETPCDPKISRSLLQEVGKRRQEMAASKPTPNDPLTPRQTEILSYIASGLSNKEIAAELNLSIATVKNHVHLVLKKLRLKSRSEAAVAASRNPDLLGLLHRNRSTASPLAAAFKFNKGDSPMGGKMPMGTT